MRSDVTALILAGGKATRLGGVDKRELVVDGKSIFQRQLDVLLPRVAEVIVSAARDVPGHRTVLDQSSGLGPLAGIAAGLAACSTEWLLVIAGDMPFIDRNLIDLMLARATECDAVGIRIGSLPEPLCCVLRATTWRSRVERRIAAGRLKASALLTEEGARVAWIEEAELRGIDPTLRVLHNVNAPEDL